LTFSFSATARNWASKQPPLVNTSQQAPCELDVDGDF